MVLIAFPGRVVDAGREAVVLVGCWSVKGGVGVTVVSAGVALGVARRQPALLVDLAGDLPACLGLAEPPGPGVAEWLRAGADVPADSLVRLEVAVAPNLDLLPRGRGELDPGRAALLVQVLAAGGRTVVVDCGRPTVGSVGLRVATEADRSVVVSRLCVLGLRALATAPLCPSGVVVLRDPGRCLTPADVVAQAGAPLLADVAVDPAVARAVDAGLLAARLPRGFVTALEAVAADPLAMHRG